MAVLAGFAVAIVAIVAAVADAAADAAATDAATAAAAFLFAASERSAIENGQETVA